MASKKGSEATSGPYTVSANSPRFFEPLQNRTDWGSSKNQIKGGSRTVRGNIEQHEPRTWK